jgi:predicted permease
MAPYVRALAVWVLLMSVETIHGIARGVLLVPLTGDLAARQIGVVVGSILILFIAFLAINWIETKNLSQLLIIGAMWAILTLMFEFLLGHFVLGLTTDRILSDYDVTREGFMIIGMLVMILSPAIAHVVRNRKTTA